MHLIELKVSNISYHVFFVKPGYLHRNFTFIKGTLQNTQNTREFTCVEQGNRCYWYSDPCCEQNSCEFDESLGYSTCQPRCGDRYDACSTDSECCSGLFCDIEGKFVSAGTCGCGGLGNSCMSNGGCCQSYCKIDGNGQGVCSLMLSQCIQIGYKGCSATDFQCCNGICRGDTCELGC